MFPLRAIAVLTLAAAFAGCQTAGTAPAEPAATRESCKIDRAADLPAHFVNGHIVIPAAINEIPVRLVVDTGATGSMLTPEAVARLHLPMDPYRTTTVHGTGGTVVNHNTSIRSLRVGGEDWLGSSMATGHLPGRYPDDPPVVGLLGADRLAQFDIELDMPHHRMTLWRIDSCFGDFVPWHAPHYVLPLARYQPNRMVTDVRVDGQPVTALVDWGARTTAITSATAASLGVTTQMLARDRSGDSHGVDQTDIPFYVHRFPELAIGPVRFRNVALDVAPLRVKDVGMLLGADYVSNRHVWLSYSTEQLFVQGPAAAQASR